MSTNPARPAGQAMPELEIPADLAIEYVNMVRIAHSPPSWSLISPNCCPARALPGSVRAL